MADVDNRQNFWQTIPGIITAIAGLTTAVGGVLGVLVNAGVIGGRHDGAPAEEKRPAVERPVEPVTATTPASVEALESELRSANVVLSTGTDADVTRVRDYMMEADSPYRQLAAASAELLRGRRLKQVGYLDMFDKWYTKTVGPDHYVDTNGTLHTSELAAAIVMAQHEIHGVDARTLAEIVEGR
jgi:hypothetical protein